MLGNVKAKNYNNSSELIGKILVNDWRRKKQQLNAKYNSNLLVDTLIMNYSVN